LVRQSPSVVEIKSQPARIAKSVKADLALASDKIVVPCRLPAGLGRSA
jgi:hypothetical protein